MDEDLESASASVSQDERPAYHPKPPKPERHFPIKPFMIALVIVALGALGFVVFKTLSKPKPSSQTESTDATTNNAAPAVSSDISNAPLSETYTSDSLNIAFKYPKTWKVSEADGGIRIESPTFNYLPAQASSLDGNFRIYIRQGARDKDAKYIGSGIAIKPSDKLTYTQPAVGQRTDTWLSSFGYDSPDIFSFFMIAGNFELKTNDTLGPNYGKEPDTYIIAGGYSGPAAADDLAMNSVRLDYYATTNAYKQALQIIASIQLN